MRRTSRKSARLTSVWEPTLLVALWVPMVRFTLENSFISAKNTTDSTLNWDALRETKDEATKRIPDFGNVCQASLKILLIKQQKKAEYDENLAKYKKIVGA